MTPPQDPFAAVSHPDPYPYYAGLVARGPAWRDPGLGMWIAASAEDVTAVLGCLDLRVRPLDEPVPRALLGGPAAEIFRHLVRMNEGSGHCPFNRAIGDVLAALEPRRVGAEAARQARLLEQQLGPSSDGSRLGEFAFRLPVQTIASLLGARDDALGEISGSAGAFVRGIAPGASGEQVEAAQAGAARLLDAFRPLLDADRLLGALAAAARRLGIADEAVILANGIGLLSQARDASAGLVGNTLLALATQEGLHVRVQAEPELLRAVVAEVVRHDAPVHNTRRFAGVATRVAGCDLQQGDAVLVLLAAANRDPAANREPARFELARSERRCFTFGLGRHACPGEALASAIATAGVSHLLAAGLPLERLAEGRSYVPSLNTRIPVFSVTQSRGSLAVAAKSLNARGR